MRLHLTYREPAFPPAIIDLTKRFMELKPSKPYTPITVFNIWAHGASLCFETTEVDVVFKRHPEGIGNYVPETATSIAMIELHKPSMISLFHNFRHHLQAHSEFKYESSEHEGQDAQAWACSLYYVCNPQQFRKAVRRDFIAGVGPSDLLKKSKKRGTK